MFLVTCDAPASSRTHGQEYKASKDRVQSPRNAQIREVLKCYECEGVEHFARECPTRLKREDKNADSPRKWDPGKAPSRPRFSGEKPPYAARREEKGEARVSGNDEA